MRFGRAVLVVSAFAALGCGRVREIKGCRALAQLMNPVLDDISERVSKDRGAPPYRHAAKEYDKLATDLGRFDLGIPRAEKSVDDLGLAIKEAAIQSAKLANAIEQRDGVVSANARRELGQIARLQKAIVNRIEGDCAGR